MTLVNKIIQGDCLEVMREYPDNHFDLVITDPPYGIGEHGGKKRYGTQSKARGFTGHKDYSDEGWDNFVPTQEYFDEIFRVSKNQIICGMNYFNLPPTKCFVFWHKKGSDGSDFADGELIYTNFDKAARYFKYDWVGFGYLNNPNKEQKEHPTQKPQALMKWLIENFTNPGDMILDPFAGSGSTLVASKVLGRQATGIEINPKYVEIANNRLRQDVLL